MKSRWKSKTWWAALITSTAGVVALFVPEVGEFMEQNSEQVTIAIGLVFAILRQLTKDGIE